MRSPRNLAFDLDRYAFSTYVIELIDSMVEGQEAEAPLFDLVEATLERIDATRGTPDAWWLRHFETKLLSLTGFEPRLDGCRRCLRSSPDPETRFRFDPRGGSLVCEPCGDGSAIAISDSGIHTLLALQCDHLEDLPTTTRGEVRMILQTFIRHHLRRPLRSPALLREILEA